MLFPSHEGSKQDHELFWFHRRFQSQVVYTQGVIQQKTNKPYNPVFLCLDAQGQGHNSQGGMVNKGTRPRILQRQPILRPVFDRKTRQKGMQ